jgi:hypothetical protein
MSHQTPFVGQGNTSRCVSLFSAYNRESENSITLYVLTVSFSVSDTPDAGT